MLEQSVQTACNKSNCNDSMTETYNTTDYDLMSTALSTAIGIIDVVGTVGNILSLVALFNMRTTAMYCILRAIAVADTVFLLCHLLFQALPNLNLLGLKLEWKTIYVGFAYCGTSARVISIWLTVLVSVERWFAVHKPLHLNGTFTTRRTIKRIAFIWLVVPIYWLPNVFIDGLIPAFWTEPPLANDSSADSGVSSSSGTLQHVSTVLHMGAFAPAMLIITACNVKIMRVLSSTRRRWAQITANQRQEYKSTRIPIWIVVMFYVSETPSLLCYVLTKFDIISMTEDMTWTVIASICNCLTVINASFNIVIYFFFARQGLLIICYASVIAHSNAFATFNAQPNIRRSFSRKSETFVLDNGQLQPLRKCSAFDAPL